MKLQMLERNMQHLGRSRAENSEPMIVNSQHDAHEMFKSRKMAQLRRGLIEVDRLSNQTFNEERDVRNVISGQH